MFEKLVTKNGWLVPINKDGEVDWVCPKCGHEHVSCCGNSHFPCSKSPQYGGDCKCSYLDSLYPKILWWTDSPLPINWLS